MSKYNYQNSNVLINKYNIKDWGYLVEKEAELMCLKPINTPLPKR